MNLITHYRPAATQEHPARPTDGVRNPHDPSPTPLRTGAEVFCDALTAHGVSILFGHPGGAILPFYDALHRCRGLRHVLTRHEQAAAHAADGYARATGRVGVCVATSGPGATNLVTGLATAMMDGVPVVAITGQVCTTSRGQDAFQEADIIGITMPVTKHGFLVECADDIPSIVNEAFALAQHGRPGPVLIDVPKDIQGAPCRAARIERRPAAHAVANPQPDIDRQLARAVALLDAAERPVVIAGRGVVLSETADALLQLAEKADLPVTTTLLGLDGFPASHPLCLGLPGMHGSVRANMSIQEADVLLGVGVRFDDRVIGRVESFAPNATVVHADISPAAMGKTVRATVELIADLRDTLPRLVSGTARARRIDWIERTRQWPRAYAPEAERPAAEKTLTGRSVSRAIGRRVARAGAIVVTDVGQHQMWLAQELPDTVPGTHLTSGGLGTMGYALPAGIGAALGRPDHPTWVVAGDGGFQMTLQELATVVQERIPLRLVVINNGFLGMVRQWQEFHHQGRYSASRLSGPDIPVLAHAYGIPARVATEHAELDAALDWANAAPGPVLVELRIVPDENVYPLVPPGASLHEIITAPMGRVPA